MTDLTVRRLLIDLEVPLQRHWCNGDPFLTAFFNALSMSFPQGEQFFIDAVRDGAKQLPEAAHAEVQAEVRGFIGQEATHRRIHALFNAHLLQQGLVNGWEPRAQQRTDLLKGSDPRHPLAVTAATEHFTAIFAHWLLEHPSLFNDRTEPRLKTLWMWHCAEEAEHRSTAFDLYQALGGNQEWRIVWFKRITSIFLSDLARQTVDNLRRDGTLWQWRTWSSAARHILGRQGLLRQLYRPWRAYFSSGFHPLQQTGEPGMRWLRENREAYAPVGSAA